MRFPGIPLFEQTVQNFRRFESVLKKSDSYSRARLLIKAPTKNTKRIVFISYQSLLKKMQFFSDKLEFVHRSQAYITFVHSIIHVYYNNYTEPGLTLLLACYLSWQDLTTLLLHLGDHGTHGKIPNKISLR